MAEFTFWTQTVYIHIFSPALFSLCHAIPLTHTHTHPTPHTHTHHNTHTHIHPHTHTHTHTIFSDALTEIILRNVFQLRPTAVIKWKVSPSQNYKQILTHSSPTTAPFS